MSDESSDGSESKVVLSLLDVLSSGLGAAIILFLIFSVLPHFGDANVRPAAAESGAQEEAGRGGGGSGGEEKFKSLTRNAAVFLEVLVTRQASDRHPDISIWCMEAELRKLQQELAHREELLKAACGGSTSHEQRHLKQAKQATQPPLVPQRPDQLARARTEGRWLGLRPQPGRVEIGYEFDRARPDQLLFAAHLYRGLPAGPPPRFELLQRSGSPFSCEITVLVGGLAQRKTTLGAEATPCFAIKGGGIDR